MGCQSINIKFLAVDTANIPQTSAGGQDPENGRECWTHGAALG